METKKRERATKSDEPIPHRPFSIEASKLDKISGSRLGSTNILYIKNYQGGILDLRFLDEVHTLLVLVIISPDNVDQEITTKDWILPISPRIPSFSLYGVRPDLSSIDTFSTWGLEFFALHKVDYTDCSHQHLDRLMARCLELITSHFPSLPKLDCAEKITIIDCDIDVLDFNKINSKILKELEFKIGKHGSISNEHLRQIRQINSLEELSLDILNSTNSVEHHINYSLLDGHPNLRALSVRGIKDSFDIPRLPSLETLSLSDIASEEIDLSPLADSKLLRGLDIVMDTYHKYPELERFDLSPLSVCTNLQWVRISNTGTAEIDLTPLLHIESLEDVFIDNWWGGRTKLTVDSRFKGNIKSPSISSMEMNGKIEWR